MDHPTHPQARPCDCDLGLHSAYRFITGDLSEDAGGDFDPHAIEPESIDKRVVLQTTWWVDIDAHAHRLEEMSLEYRSKVLHHLDQQAPTWLVEARVASILQALHRTTAPETVAAQMRLLDTLPPGWIQHTPLCHRLHALDGTRPVAIRPHTYTRAVETDRPETLHDDDHGTWQVTTESTSTYQLDLDRRRIRRLPGGPNANGHTPPPPGMHVSHLAFDHEWIDLEAVVHCLVGQPLLVLDKRSSAGGFRISTRVVAITRTPPATPAARAADPEPGQRDE